MAATKVEVRKSDATGWTRGGLTLAATRMLREKQSDATVLTRGDSRWQLPGVKGETIGCHGLDPWRAHVGSYQDVKEKSWMPRA